MVFTWRHRRHVGAQNKREKIRLGIWLYYYARHEPSFAIVLCTNMAGLWRDWKITYIDGVCYPLWKLIMFLPFVFIHTLLLFIMKIISEISFSLRKSDCTRAFSVKNVWLFVFWCVLYFRFAYNNLLTIFPHTDYSLVRHSLCFECFNFPLFPITYGQVLSRRSAEWRKNT